MIRPADARLFNRLDDEKLGVDHHLLVGKTEEGGL